MELNIKITTKTKAEAHQLVALLKIEHEVTEVKLDGEKFNVRVKRDRKKIEEENKTRDKK